MYDVIVVGGSYAGMAAALQLVRGRRNVAVLDAGQRRNRFAGTSHGLLGQDGRSPSEIAGEAKAQLAKYPNLSWRDDTAVGTEMIEDQFIVRTTKDEVLTAKRLVLATGVTDELPPVPGLAERWGRSIFHCPYCHGYELNYPPVTEFDGRVANDLYDRVALDYDRAGLQLLALLIVRFEDAVGE